MPKIVPPVSRTPRYSITDELGTSGLKHSYGILDEEYLRELKGPRGMKVLREMTTGDVIFGAILYGLDALIRGVRWRVVPDEAAVSLKEAEARAQFVRECLFEDLSQAWADVVSEGFSFVTYGWAWA